MSNYYEKRDAKVRIARELMRMGWTVYGFKEDTSDSMTDYYNPANWNGVAEKNGYILVVDCGVEKEKEITRYNPNYISISEADRNKIESLKNMTVERGASEGEEKASQKLIEKIQAKYKNEGVSQYEVIGKIPAHLGNPNRVMWHLEKDGVYVDKGNKLTVYADVPESYIFNIDTMTFTDGYKKVYTWEDGERVYKDRELKEHELKAVNELKSLILRLERLANIGNACGDGTKATQEAGDEQQQNEVLVKKTIQKVKKVIKPVKVDRDFVKVGDYVNYKGDRATRCYWKVTDVSEERKTFTYQSTGKKYQEVKNCKRYYNHLSKLNDLYDIFELQEVEEIETVEKWVKVKNTAKKAEKVVDEVENNNNEVVAKDNVSFGNYTIEESEHTKTGEKIYLVKFEKTLSKDEYIELNKKIKSLGGWYSKYTHSFIFKDNPEKILQENFVSNNEQVEDNQEKINSLCNCIVDASSDYITENNLSRVEYWNNEGYRKNLINKLNEIKVNKKTLKAIISAIQIHEEYKEYKKLIEVLNNLYKANKVNNVNDKEKIISKIDKQIESNDKKINDLSGNYLTNTWKRMKEQESRDNKKSSLIKDNDILNYIKEKINSNKASGFEIALINRTLRDDFKSYYNRYEYNIKRNEEYKDLYPCINPNWVNSEWNKDRERQIKRLKNINLNNDSQLKNCLKNDFKSIIDVIENNSNVSENEIIIKRLEREYKMQQRGDINFTPKELVNVLIDYADIQEGEKILEPSAGIGNIADEVKKINSNIDCIEYMHNYNELLKLKGYNVIGNDFMECEKFNIYDKVIMNPPFSKECEMIQHAYNVLKDTGKIVAITSSHWTFANDKKSIEFREWLDNLTYEIFESDIKFEMTNVNYKILVIDKDENINSIAM